MNCGVQFQDGGRSFKCNFCSVSNDVPEQYFCNLDHTGRRHDIAQRPELTCGTVEYKATEVYCARPPQPASYLFAIDVTYNAVKSGMVSAAAQAIREVLNSFAATENSPDGQDLSNARIGIMSFGGGIQFYNLTAGLGQPQMMVMTDLKEPFVPLQVL